MTFFSSNESRRIVELLDSTSESDKKLAKEIIKASNKTLFIMNTLKRLLLCSVIFIIYCIVATKFSTPPPDSNTVTGEIFTWVAGGVLLILNSIFYILRGEKYD